MAAAAHAQVRVLALQSLPRPLKSDPALMYMVTVTGSSRSGMTHETVTFTLQEARRLAVMLGLLLLAAPAVTFARATPGDRNAAFTRQLLSYVDRSRCATVDENSGNTANCAGDLPIPACCYDDGRCSTNGDAQGGTCYGSKGGLAGCCPA